MKVAIIGFGTEGKSSYRYYTSKGYEVVIHDESTNINFPKKAKAILGTSYLDNLDVYDLILRSPGIKPEQIITKNPSVKGKISTQLNEFVKQIQKDQLIGVTGTKGKGTTSSLLASIIKASGRQAIVAGNIGLPLLDIINLINDQTYVVMELSSFQLIDFKGPSPHIAICLMVKPEHLNWHKNLDEYLSAKANLFNFQNEQDFTIYFDKNDLTKTIINTSPGNKIPYFAPPGAVIDDDKVTVENQPLFDINKIQLLGQHNWQNVCAAITAFWQIDHDLNAVKKAVSEFTGLEHRLQFIRQLNGVKYYDDSFGTTPDTAIVALKAFNIPKVIILGGSDKNSKFDELAFAIKNNAYCRPLIIGQTRHKIALALDRVGFKDYKLCDSQSMSEVVKQATDMAKILRPNESEAVVLLSPACASFDMFKDYKDRAKQFIKAVEGLV